MKGIKLPDWKYFENTPNRKIKGRFDTLIKERVFRESIPDWIDNIGVKELGLKKWEKELSALNKQAQVVLRTNTLKIDKELLQSKLEDEGVLTTINKDYSDALILDERKNVFRTEAFKNGWFEVQDASSQLVAEYLNVEPGMVVVDCLCRSRWKNTSSLCTYEK